MKRLLIVLLSTGLLAYALATQWQSFDRMGERRFGALEHLPKEILVGVCWPFEARQDGLEEGLQLAREEINAGGLAAGVPIRLVMRDSKGDWEEAKRIAIEFSNTPKMSAVLGYYDSSLAIKATTMYEPSRLLTIVVGANATSITSHGFDYVVRTTVSGDKIARAGKAYSGAG
jgi:branched-chain amino acid transport system substrate-binding protein